MESAAIPATIRSRPTASIIAAAVFQIVVSILALILFKRGLMATYFSGEYMHAPEAVPILAGLFSVALVDVILGIGLLRLRSWARRASLVVASLALCASAVAAMLYQRKVGFDFTPLVLDCLVAMLIPVNIWWWILFTRKGVRAQFE